MIAYIGFGIVLLVGLALLGSGLRGRRVDDHPLCRKCGYDLSGSEATPDVCPECGRALSVDRAVRLGHRRRRSLVISLATVLVMGSGGTLGVLGWGEANDFDWNTVKPAWWLMRDAADPTTTNSAAARDELLNRIADDRLSDSQVDTLVELALSVQADRTRRWNPNWGEMIEYAWDRNQLDAMLIEQYLKGIMIDAIEFSWRATESIEFGNQFETVCRPFRISTRLMGAANWNDVKTPVRQLSITIEVNGFPEDKPNWEFKKELLLTQMKLELPGNPSLSIISNWRFDATDEQRELNMDITVHIHDSRRPDMPVSSATFNLPTRVVECDYIP